MTTILSQNATIYISSVDLDSVASSPSTVSKLNIVNPSISTSSTKDTQRVHRVTGEAATTTFIKTISPTTLKVETYTKINAAGDPADYRLWECLLGNYTNAGDPATSDLTNFTTLTPPYLFMLIDFGDAVFKFSNCLVESCSLSVSHSDIIKTVWTIKTVDFGSFSGSMPTSYTDRTESTNFLKAKASVVSITNNSINYDLPMLEAGIDIKNKVEHLHNKSYSNSVADPGKLAIIGRETKGKLKCYLRTGSNNSLGFLTAMLSSPSDINDLTSNIVMDFGATTGKRLTIEAPNAIVSWPSVAIGSALDITFDFFVQGSTIVSNDGLIIKFYR